MCQDFDTPPPRESAWHLGWLEPAPCKLVHLPQCPGCLCFEMKGWEARFYLTKNATFKKQVLNWGHKIKVDTPSIKRALLCIKQITDENLLYSMGWGGGKKVQSVCSVQFSHSFVSDSLRPHDSQHARPPCPSPTPGVHLDSHPSSQ